MQDSRMNPSHLLFLLFFCYSPAHSTDWFAAFAGGINQQNLFPAGSLTLLSGAQNGLFNLGYVGVTSLHVSISGIHTPQTYYPPTAYACTRYLIGTYDYSGTTYGILNSKLGISVSDSSGNPAESCLSVNPPYPLYPSLPGYTATLPQYRATLHVREDISSPVSVGNMDVVNVSLAGDSLGHAISIADTMLSSVEKLTFSGTVTPPSGCTISAGQTIAVDLGAIKADDLVSGGIGNAPTGYSRVSKPVTVQCTNGTLRTGSLSASLQGTSASGFGNYLSTSDNHVGVRVTDSSGNTLNNNDSTSSIPLTWDSNGNATFNLGFEPVYLGNGIPATSHFSGTGSLIFNYP